MIPMLLRVRVVRETGRSLRLWVPLFVLWIMALPFVLLALPFVLIALRMMTLKAFRTVGLVWELFAGLRGTHVEAGGGRESVLVRIY
jgi:hypothetical protein